MMEEWWAIRTNMQKIRFEEEIKGGGSKVGFLWIGRVTLFFHAFQEMKIGVSS